MDKIERDVVTNEAELRRLTDEAHRAIGRYVVAFSQLIYQMRTIVTQALTKDSKLGDLAFGQASAQQIADSFFSICRYRGQLDKAEVNIANQLQDEVGEKVIQRNKIMHGELWVGGGFGGSRKILERARLDRIDPNRRDGDSQQFDLYSITVLDGISDQLIDLRVLVDDFGRAALGLRMRRADGKKAARGKYRVSDVLVALNVPQSGKGGTVVRAGPRADELYAGPLFG
jgi:hypothetical protein